MYQYVLFDLDGTLTDPKEGICKSVQFALQDQGIVEPDIDKLEPFIGPPLKQSFTEFYAMDEASVEQAVKEFRKRFESIGLFENEIYPGMKRMLEKLHDQGVKMAIASSKPKMFVDRILEHFEIAEYFDVITGSDANEKKVEKIDVMREALAKLFDVKEEAIVANDAAADDVDGYYELKKKAKRVIPIDEILMIGDRKFDVEGAKYFFLDSIGVSYGYAPEGELEAAGATYVCEDLESIYEIITKEKLNADLTKNRFVKSARVLAPLVYDFAITFLVLFIVEMIFEALIQGPLSSYAGWAAEQSKMLAAYFDAVATIVCALVFVRMYQREHTKPISHVIVKRHQKKMAVMAPWFVGAMIFGGVFLNVLFTFLKVISSSASFEQVASVQYSVPFVAGLLIYGVIKPIEEEVLFRGIIYGRMKRIFPTRVAISSSAVLFGAYHQNMVQLIYGMIMGLFLAMLYEEFKSIKVPILAHSAVNVVVFTIGYYGILNRTIFSIPGLAVSFVGAVIFLVGYYHKSKRL